MNDEKAKCAHCGKDMDQVASPNWKMYCTDKPCVEAFKQNVMAPRSRKKKALH